MKEYLYQAEMSEEEKMKRNLRFYFALFFAKCTALVLKLIGRKGTSMPGSWAIILCPDFLGRIEKPKRVIGITGTNGKTTVANMVEDVLEDQGYDFTCNRSGTNVNTGVASSLIADSTFWGRPKKDLAVFELDERSSPKILQHIKPELLLCTNIFRDSYKRNAHMEFILDILNKSIPLETKLILNGDDLLCAGIRPENERVYYGIQQMPGETPEIKNIVCDVRSCPQCAESLTWDFIRYHHIGRAHCQHCGFVSPGCTYEVTDIQSADMEIRIGDEKCRYPLANDSLINVYNSLSAVAFLSEFGIPRDKIIGSMRMLSISESRYQETTVNEKKIILHLAKGQNPVACSRVFDNVRKYPGRKAAMLFIEDYFDAAKSVENMSWLYDTDFEFLGDESITQIVVAGARHLDTYVRLLLADVPEERISHTTENNDAAAFLKPELFDAVFILYDVYTIGLANGMKSQVAKILEERGTENEG